MELSLGQENVEAQSEISCDLNAQVVSTVQSEAMILWVLMTVYISR